MNAARSLAETFAAHNVTLVYGGGTVGIMGEVARTLVSLSGPDSVLGIIPSALIKFEQGDQQHPDPSIYGRTEVVKDMHTRKRLMAQHVIAGGRGSGFVALSGGYGTLEELMEITTWNQLGIHHSPVVLFNVDGYWDGLLAWVDEAVTCGFIDEPNKWILSEAKDAPGVIKALREYVNSEGKYELEWESEG